MQFFISKKFTEFTILLNYPIFNNIEFMILTHVIVLSFLIMNTVSF